MVGRRVDRLGNGTTLSPAPILRDHRTANGRDPSRNVARWPRNVRTIVTSGGTCGSAASIISSTASRQAPSACVLR